MLKENKAKVLILMGTLVIFLIAILGVKQAQIVDQGHSSFENYYTFRGCTKLLQKTPDYGFCKIANGQTIKMVKYKEKWYLDGDLPGCLLSFCF